MQPASAMRCSICCRMGEREKNPEKKPKPYFPMFVDLSEKQILCIGGGTIATRRIRTLTRFTDHLIVLAPEICEEMKELLEQFPITWIRRKLEVEEMFEFEREIHKKTDIAEGEFSEEQEENLYKQVEVNLAENAEYGKMFAPDKVEKISAEEFNDENEDVIEQMIHSSYIVLAATDDHELNHAVVKACKKRGILVNTCDDKSQCDYYFPAVTEVDGVIIGLNSGGKDPQKVSRVRQQIEKMKEQDRSVDPE